MFGTGGGTGAPIVFTVLADMDVADTAHVILDIAGGAKAVDLAGNTLSHFSGELVA